MSPALATWGFAGVALLVSVFGAVCGLGGAIAGVLWTSRRRRPARRPRHRREPDAPPLIVAAPTDPLRDIYRPRPR
ncbi:hypothetical protein [Actinomadura nitritigenes]|uniref:hypothetical protein n=1 Tax=Actinomadura nitritigenes TaxID=134602 RepID=UPI003D90B7D5